MNIIEKIQEQLLQFNINRTTLDNLKNIETFKHKFNIVPVCFCTVIFYLTLFCFFFVIESEHFFDANMLIIMLSFLFGIMTFNLFSKIKINGWYFKAASLVFSRHRSLHSFISYANEQDKIIIDMFNNSSIAVSIVEFYKTMNKINFSYSPILDNVYLSNDEIAFNLQAINKIIENLDEKSFLKFFKEKFLINFYYYSQHPHVIELMGKNDLDVNHNSVVDKSFIPMQDILETINTVDLKQKFKAAL